MTTLAPSHNSLFLLHLAVQNCPLVRKCPRSLRSRPLLSAMVRFCPKLSPTPSRSLHPQNPLHTVIVNAIYIHQPCRSQLLISTATPWRNWPLNHPRRRPPSSVLFCLKLKPRYARERPTNRS